MARPEVNVQLNLTLVPDPAAHSLLVGAGWTPPPEEGKPGRHDGCITWADHMAALRDHALRIRKDVANEIADDLEKPRDWQFTAGGLAPWAVVARQHATPAQELPFPLDGLACDCGHLRIKHGGPDAIFPGCLTPGCTCAQTGPWPEQG